MASSTDAPSGTVTFLFTDMEGSSPAWDQHGAAMSVAQERHDAILRSAIDASRGYVFATGGDGMAAAFASAREALTAAVRAQRALTAERWPDPLSVRVRMGLHTGQAIERDGNYFGPDVIRAARIMSVVDGGRVVCSRATRDLVDERLAADLQFMPVGLARLKGLSAPAEVFAVAGPGLEESGHAIASAPRLPRTAPRSLHRLVGRERETSVVVDHLQSGNFVTITGIGGVGKTRLATTVVERLVDDFEDGVAWVELAPISHDEDVVQAVADVLQVRSQHGEALVDTVSGALVGRRVLIMLDNCEHVREGAAAVATAIVRSCRAASVLATSRERLGVDGERVVPLSTLSATGRESPALELLRERIGDPDDDGANDASLIEIAERLDGLPLALELAAARCRSLGPTDVAARLRAEYDILADRTRSVERHRTLERALDWSFQLLDDHERAVLECVSLFAGGFDLAAAEAVAGDHVDDIGVDDAFASLVDKSLVQRQNRQFRLLETTRQFAGRRLDRSEHRDVATQRYVTYVVDQLRRVHDGSHGPDEARWVSELDLMWPDVRTVFRRSMAIDDADTTITVVTHLAVEGFMRRPEALSWIRAAVDRFGERPGPHQHELLGAGGMAAWALVDVPAALGLAERALALDRAPGTALDCLPERAAIGAYNFAGRFDEAADVCRATLQRLPPSDDGWQVASMWSNLALSLAIATPLNAEALEASSVAVELAVRAGNPTNLGIAHFSRALCLLDRDPAAAAVACERAIAFADEVRNQWLIGTVAAVAASTVARRGDPQEALRATLAASDELHRTGWTTHAWSAAWGAVALLWKLGQHDLAALVAGGCANSGVANLGMAPVPAQIAALAHDDGSDRLLDLYRAGSRHPLPELIRSVLREAPPAGKPDGGSPSTTG